MKQNGFTLIEMLIYAGIVSTIAGVLTLFLISNMRAYDKSQARQNVFNNVNDALRVIGDEIKYAASIYTPTSVLASNSGQLSLETVLNAPAGETTTFVDYFLDNGRIYEKREGAAQVPLTSERVFVERMRFDRKTSTAPRDSVSVQIEARINTQSTDPADQARLTLVSSASLRGTY